MFVSGTFSSRNLLISAASVLYKTGIPDSCFSRDSLNGRGSTCKAIITLVINFSCKTGIRKPSPGSIRIKHFIFSFKFKESI
ncbi:MAG: hypothetical protein FWD24_01745 [Treponema sp.]|nr:hypothetical protein [Treponema sp.]